MKKLIISLCLLFTSVSFCSAQFLMDMLDTTKEAGKGLLGIYKKFDHLRIGGYIQPQFQVIETDGAKSFEGGDFGAHVSNRFMLRRSRIRIDYMHINDPQGPGVQIVFQFDANERSFTVRDVWGRIFENKLKLFSFTTGMFARPFGYETNLSSSDRESPERGRMNQTLMKSERDLGAMVTFDVRKEKHPLKKIRIDAGFFNGQGINAAGDFDNRKDFISRIALKPVLLGKEITLTAGASFLQGGLLQNTRFVNSTISTNGVKAVVSDSAASNAGQYSPRTYYGTDVQLKMKTGMGVTELRGEFISGKQTGTFSSSETPTVLLSGIDGFYRRNFRGAYFYFLQQLFSPRHQLVIKFDWYDPNTSVKGNEITPSGRFSAADIKYTTLNIGYNGAISPFIKLALFYAFVNNEATLLPVYLKDIRDNIFTARLQFRF